MPPLEDAPMPAPWSSAALLRMKDLHHRMIQDQTSTIKYESASLHEIPKYLKCLIVVDIKMDCIGNG